MMSCPRHQHIASHGRMLLQWWIASIGLLFVGVGAFTPTPQNYLATCIPGLAPVLADELRDLGASSVETSGSAAVTFTNQKDPHVGLKALLWLRTAHRLLEQVPCYGHGLETREDLYDAVRNSVDVKNLLGDGKGGLLTLSVKVIVNGRVPKDISHSHYDALTIKNALVDEVRDLRGDRPDVDTDGASVPLVGIMLGTGERADMTLYRSLHPPGSLHRRGYRIGAIHKASMKESMAAGLLLAAGWKTACRGDRWTLVDPMCGSGSLVIEAAMMAANIAPGLMRIKCSMPGQSMPPVLRWKSDDDLSPIWKDLLMDATQCAKQGLQRIANSSSIHILANDVHDGALDILESSLSEAGLSHVVQVHQQDCRDWKITSDGPLWVVTNPPWGVRLTDEDHQSWESLRTFLRSCPPNTEAWVLSGNKAATKHLGLKRSQSIVLRTAQQDLRWLQYFILDKSSSKGKDEMQPKNVLSDARARTGETSNIEKDAWV